VAERPLFYFDVGSPWCWLAAERVNHALDEVPEWVPVLAAGLPGAVPGDVDRAEVERRAAELELPPLRWPEPFPFDSRTAMLAATFAKQSGRVVAFSLAAMRQAFAGGRDLSVTDNVLLAAAACELHPRALLKGIELRSVQDALRDATAEAAAAGVVELPAVTVGGQPARASFWEP
jgi:2-hydroxychromene-2-carboxylate isomerase